MNPGSNWKSPPQSAVEDPGGTIWIADSIGSEVWQELATDYAVKRNFAGSYRVVSDRHSEGFNAVFGDGHVKWMRTGSTMPCMWSIQKDDCKPAGDPTTLP